MVKPGRRDALPLELGGTAFAKRIDGTYGRERGQRVLYITERAVFRLCAGGIELIEISPGIDMQRNVIDKMDFKPNIVADLKTIDIRLFKPERLKLADELHRRMRPPRSQRLELPKAAQ